MTSAKELPWPLRCCFAVTITQFSCRRYCRDTLTKDSFKQDTGRVRDASGLPVTSQAVANRDGPQSRFFVLTGERRPELYRKSYGETNNTTYAR